MHVIYVRDTADEAIYGKEDWSDLTGPSSNTYWVWALGADEAVRAPGPPRTPLALEDDEWEKHGRRSSDPPRVWSGVIPDGEYSVDTLGNVTTPAGATVANPQSVGVMFRRAGRSAGKFRVTPQHRIVLVGRRDTDGHAFVAVGQLTEPFRPRGVEDQVATDRSADLRLGEPYQGPGDKEGGSFSLRSTRGGVVARRRLPAWISRSRILERSEVSATNVAEGLAAWRLLGGQGRPFYVDSLGRAWVSPKGALYFPADVPGGFSSPAARELTSDPMAPEYRGYWPSVVARDAKYHVTAKGAIRLIFRESRDEELHIEIGGHRQPGPRERGEGCPFRTCGRRLLPQ